MDYTYLYPNYLEAAKKHYKACKRIFQLYERCEKNKYDDRYLFNEIYYIFGYILEGISVYMIFKHFGYEKSKSIENCHEDESFIKKAHVTYHFGEGTRKYGNSLKKISNHNFQEYTEALAQEFAPYHIPYLSKDVPLNEDTQKELRLKKLIKEWKPDVRYRKYKDPFELSESDVQSIISLCQTILKKIQG